MPQTKSAEATIRGFLFQFQETVIQLFDSEEKITVEGLDQDIEIRGVHIQCKYYKDWNNSNLASTIIPMYKHFLKNKSIKIKYQLNLHTKSDTSIDISHIKNLKYVLGLTKSGLKNLDKSTIKEFQERLAINKSNSIEDNNDDIAKILASSLGVKSGKFLYNSLIGKILEISAREKVEERVITQGEVDIWLKNSTNCLAMEWNLARKTAQNYNKIAKRNIIDHTNTRTIVILYDELCLTNTDLLAGFTKKKISKYASFPSYCFHNILPEYQIEIKDKLFEEKIKFHDEFPHLTKIPKFRKHLEVDENYIKFINFENIPSLVLLYNKFTIIHIYSKSKPEEIENTDNIFVPVNSFNQLLNIYN